MAGFSDYTEKKVLDFLFKQTTMGTAPATLWFSLHGADPSDTGASELYFGTGSYGRAACTPDTNNTTHTQWNAVTVYSSTKQRMSNKVDIKWPVATANWNGGTAIQFWGCYDASTAGNFLFGGSISGGGVVVLDTNQLMFAGASPTGNLTFDID